MILHEQMWNERSLDVDIGWKARYSAIFIFRIREISLVVWPIKNSWYRPVDIGLLARDDGVLINCEIIPLGDNEITE